MKKKLLNSMRALLVAAGLCAGATSAWAGTTTLLNIDYSTVSTPAWTVVGGTGTITDGAWVHAQGGGSGPRSAYLDFGVNSSIDDNWTASFDVTTTTGSTWTQASKFQVALAAEGTTYPGDASNSFLSSNILLGVRLETARVDTGSDLACTITVNSVDETDKVTLSHGTKYTFSVSVTGTSMEVSIKNGTTTVFSKNVTLAGFVKPRGIFDLLPRPYNASWGVYSNTYDNVTVSKEVSVEEVSAPSIAAAYNGDTRTVTITPGVSSESNTVTTYYTTDGEDPTSSSNVYSTPIEIDAACTVKAISIASTSVASTIASQNVIVGKLKLATPTFTKTGYADGKYTVTMTSNQSGLSYPPASPTHYYSIDGEAAVAYSGAFELTAGSSVTGYVSADKYDNSDEASISSAVRPILSEVWSIDFAGQASADKGQVNIGETAFAANGVDFGNITSDGLTSNENFGVKTGTSWLLRNNSRGLYSANGSGTPVGVKDLTTGQYIKMVVADISSFYASGAASLDDNMSTTTEKYIVVNEDGNANINFNRYGYIKSIAVYDVISAVSATIPSSGFGTIASAYALDCSKLPQGVKAFKVAEVTAKAVTLAEVTEAVAAGTGLILKGTAGTYSIPVAATGATLSDNLLNAAVEATDVAANQVYILKDGEFHLVTAASTVPAGKAYLSGVPTNARSLVFEFGDEATGISAVSQEVLSGEFYNLQGQRVDAPKKGLYIVNGKKVIIK